jgi:predicted metal-dependent hydrolase
MDGLTANTETMQEMGRRLFGEGVREFDACGFFEAHDLWEEFWQELRGPDREFVQALIHLAVGAYHHDNGNMNGAKSQLAKALRKLAQYPALHWGVDTGEWVAWAGEVLVDSASPIRPAGLPFDSTRFPAHIPMAPR